MNQEKIGKFIAQCRKNKKLTQEELGEQLGVTGKTVSRWENGNYMPDLSLLIPLSKKLDITLNELLLGEKIENSKLKEKAEQSLKITIDYSKKQVGKTKRKMWRYIIILIVVFVIILGSYTYFRFTPNAIWHEGDVSQWQDLFPQHSAYELALNIHNQPVFKHPNKAFKQAKVDYSDAIAFLQNEYHLPPFSRYTYRDYGVLGWQIESDNQNLIVQGKKLTGFLDIYENSFQW